MTTITLSEAVLLVRQRSNMERSGFVTDAEIASYLNTAYTHLYDLLVSSYGDEYFSKSATLVQSGENYEFAIPSDFYKLIAISAKSGNHYFPLKKSNSLVAEYSSLNSSAEEYRISYVPSFIKVAFGFSPALVAQAEHDISAYSSAAEADALLAAAEAQALITISDADAAALLLIENANNAAVSTVPLAEAEAAALILAAEIQTAADLANGLLLLAQALIDQAVATQGIIDGEQQVTDGYTKLQQGAGDLRTALNVQYPIQAYIDAANLLIAEGEAEIIAGEAAIARATLDLSNAVQAQFDAQAIIDFANSGTLVAEATAEGDAIIQAAITDDALGAAAALAEATIAGGELTAAAAVEAEIAVGIAQTRYDDIIAAAGGVSQTLEAALLVVASPDGEFEVENCWDDYLVAHAAIKCLSKEESDIQPMMMELGLASERIIKMGASRDVGQPTQVIDVRSEVTGFYGLGYSIKSSKINIINTEYRRFYD